MEQTLAKCPICGTKFDPSPDRKHKPFCSERCRMVDLSRWLGGEYVIPGPPAIDLDAFGDLDELDNLLEE